MTFICPDELKIKRIEGKRALVERQVKEIHDSEGFTYGGYGKATYETELRKVLTREEWRELVGAYRLSQKGLMDELRRKYDGEIDMEKINARILERAMQTPRVIEMSRRGERRIRISDERSAVASELEKG